MLTGASDLDPSLEAGSLAGGDGAPTPDAPPPFDAGKPFTVVDIADVGSADRSTGHADQGHVVWAPKAARWILFYVTSAARTALRTKISPDFATWTDGAELALPHAHGGEGRNVAIARATITDQDVFHFALSRARPTATSTSSATRSPAASSTAAMTGR